MLIFSGPAATQAPSGESSFAGTARKQPDSTCSTGLLLKGKRVLLVEDSWHIALAMKRLLESAGLVVVGPFARLDVAEAALEGHKDCLDLAVVDINLQGKLATGLVERLKAQRLPVVVVSGYEIVDGIRDTVDAFLTKPVRKQALFSALSDVLSRPSDRNR